MKVSDVIKAMNQLAPPQLALGRDPVGLHTGHPDKDVSGITVCLDVTEEVIGFAKQAGHQMIVCHHPLLYNPITSLVESEPHASLIAQILRAELSVFSAHTNWDVAPGGLNDHLAEILGLTDVADMEETFVSPLYKISVFVPDEALEPVRLALADNGAGVLGDYRDCSYRTKGVGTFTPVEGANPHIGSVGNSETVEEWRLEVVVHGTNKDKALSAMLKAHPYEEPAYDIFRLENRGKPFGIGRIGDLDEAVSLRDFAGTVSAILDESGVRIWGDPEQNIKRVAVCGGSGGDLVALAKTLGADAYLTSDIRHHQFIEAHSRGLALIEASHRATESPGMRHLATRLADLTSLETTFAYMDSIGEIMLEQ